jgi:hypothetical protein
MTTTTAQTNALLQLPQEIFYVEASIRPGMTISEYQRNRPRPTRWERLRRAGR